MNNIKDTLTTYAAYAMSICTTIIGLPLAVAAINPAFTLTLPPLVNVICGFIIAISIVITQVFSGKNADGTTKTDHQISNSLKK